MTERASKNIRVYNEDLIHLETIKVSNVIQSIHRGLAVAKNMKVVIDGLDAVGLLSEGRAGGDEEVCHFYKNMNCVESVRKYEQDKAHTRVYVTDSCENQVKEFAYNSAQATIEPMRSFKVESGVAIDAVRSPAGFVAVLTHSPTKIDVLSLNGC